MSIIDEHNSANLKEFVKNKKILMLIPTCMINIKECEFEAHSNIVGYKCSSRNTECNKSCQVYQLKEICKIHGIHYRILGNSMVEKAINEYKPDSVIGIACENKLIEHIHQASQCVRINNIEEGKVCNNSCKESKINLSELENILDGVNNGL